MSTQVKTGSEVKLTVTFRNLESGDPVPLDDVEYLELEIKDLSDDSVRYEVWWADSATPTTPPATPHTQSPNIAVEDVDSADATPIPFAVFSYQWEGSAVEGSFQFTFTGHFFDDTTSDIVQTISVVSVPVINTTLGERQDLLFATDASPIYLDPEEFIYLFPEATQVEILELVHRFSQEVYNYYTPEEPSLVAYEYIRAAVECALSRTYGGFSGGGSETLTLGDLTVGNQAYPKTIVNRGNASNACELAAALRNEMIRVSGNAGIKAVVPGTNYRNPMPRRHIRSFEKGS